MSQDQFAAITDEVTDLQNAVRETTAKVAAIEAAREAEGRSFLKKFTVAGTTLALVLSLVTGLYALYDQFIVKRAEKLRAEQDALREVAEGLNKLQDDFVFRVTPLTNPMQREQAQRLLNIRSEILLQKGRTLIAELGPHAGLAELLVLGYYEMNRGNLNGARLFLDLAFGKKEAVSEVTSGEIFATLGTLYMQQGPQQDLVKGREYFDLGYKALSVRNDPTLVYSRGQLKAQWGFWEIAGGDKTRGCGLLAEGRNDILSLPPMALQNVQYTVQTIEAQAQQAACPPP